MRAIPQERPSGCAVACVAAVTGKTYGAARKLFAEPDHDALRGFYCPDIVAALKKSKRDYTFEKVTKRNSYRLINQNTIVFIKPTKQYVIGHFLVRGERGWMNPWINCPQMVPVKAGFQKTLPGTPTWIVYPVD